MPTCIVPLCPNRSSFPNKNPSKHIFSKNAISFHRLPRNEIQRKRWLENLKIPGVTQKQPYVCSVHFRENSFEKVGNRTYLRNNAVPILWPEDQEMSEDEGEEKTENHCAITSEAQLLFKNNKGITQLEREITEDIITYCTDEKISDSTLTHSVPFIRNSQIFEHTYGGLKFEVMNLAPVLDHDYSISPILENCIPLESKNRASSISPERKCCSERHRNIVKIHRSTSISPVRKIDTPDVLVVNHSIEHENKRKQVIIDNLKRKLQKQDKQIANLKMKLLQVQNRT